MRSYTTGPVLASRSKVSCECRPTKILQQQQCCCVDYSSSLMCRTRFCHGPEDSGMRQKKQYLSKSLRGAAEKKNYIYYRMPTSRTYTAMVHAEHFWRVLFRIKMHAGFEGLGLVSGFVCWFVATESLLSRS